TPIDMIPTLSHKAPRRGRAAIPWNTCTRGPASSDATLSTYRHVVATRLPVYTVSDMRDRTGRIVHYERLLLPFATEGSEVDRILASLETVSPLRQPRSDVRRGRAARSRPLRDHSVLRKPAFPQT